MKQVTIRQELLYAAPYVIKAMAFTPLLAFIPSFYSKDFGIPLALVGAILFVSRIFDVVTDPLVGLWSDGARTPIGRRKPFMIAGAPLLMVAVWMVFAPPVAVTPAYAAVWLSLVYLGFTLVDIPYRAWGAELASSYDGRTRIVAFREAAGTLSSLLALGLIMTAPALGLGSTAETLRIMAIVFVVGLPIFLALALIGVREPPADHLTETPVPVRASLMAIAKNTPFLWLLGGMTVLIGGAIIGASLHLIVMESYFDIRPLFPFILAGESLAGLASAPFWVWLSRRMGKNNALALCALAMGLLSAPIPFLRPDQWELYAGCIVVRGFAGGGLGILMASMLADVRDVDLAATGRSRTGLFFAIMGMVGKLGAALGVLVGAALPPVFGFEPSNPTNSEGALRALLMTYAWIPMLIMGGSAYFFWRYPLSRTAQAALQSEIAARRTGG